MASCMTLFGLNEEYNMRGLASAIRTTFGFLSITILAMWALLAAGLPHWACASRYVESLPGRIGQEDWYAGASGWHLVVLRDQFSYVSGEYLADAQAAAAKAGRGWQISYPSV